MALENRAEWHKWSKFPYISALWNTNIACISVCADSNSCYNLALYTFHTCLSKCKRNKAIEKKVLHITKLTRYGSFSQNLVSNGETNIIHNDTPC